MIGDDKGVDLSTALRDGEVLIELARYLADGVRNTRQREQRDLIEPESNFLGALREYLEREILKTERVSRREKER